MIPYESLRDETSADFGKRIASAAVAASVFHENVSEDRRCRPTA
jgi:hypothetical protein